MEKWLEEEGSKWVNDMHTVVFEFPSGNLAGEKSLEFTQMVWRCQGPWISGTRCGAADALSGCGGIQVTA